MQLIFTPIYAALLGFIIITLALKVVYTRRSKRIGLGSKGDKELTHKMRIHANAIEYIPIAIILMAFVEIGGANIYWVNASGFLLVIGRLLHAYGFGKSIGISFGRFYGTLMTWLVIIANATYILFDRLAYLLA